MVRLDKVYKATVLGTGLHFRQCRTAILKKRETQKVRLHTHPAVCLGTHSRLECRGGAWAESSGLTERQFCDLRRWWDLVQQNVEEEEEGQSRRPLKPARVLRVLASGGCSPTGQTPLGLRRGLWGDGGKGELTGHRRGSAWRHQSSG